jgi:hypothetical protein
MNVWIGVVIALTLALLISVRLRAARELLAEDERILAEEFNDFMTKFGSPAGPPPPPPPPRRGHEMVRR